MKPKKIGLFLCKCGTNIANFIDMEDIGNWASKLQSVSSIETHDLLCSPKGKEWMGEQIRKHGIEYAVVAACSPKMHEKTFQKVMTDEGKNMASLQMANIREHAGWVTTDKALATEKAKKLIQAALNRIELHESLELKYLECNTDVVIIGGGIAGIEAALSLGNAGRNVTLIEKEISIGGSLIKTEEVAPNMECAPCLLAPRLSAIREHSQIKVVTNAEVLEVRGFFGHFLIKVKQKARYVKNSCIGCEACFEECPVSVPSSFHHEMGNRKAIYALFPGSVPAAAAIDKDHCLHFKDNSCEACKTVCPFQSIDFDDQDQVLELEAGAILVSTGFSTLSPDQVWPGISAIDNVYSLPDFERLASSNGPTGGVISLKNGPPPSKVAVIHCAGSLSEKGVPYCSGICCMTALKAGELLRKKTEGVEVFNICNRLVFPDPSYHTFYEKQIAEGTRFIQVKELDKITFSKSESGINVSCGEMEITVDMVILANAIVPQTDATTLSGLLNIAENSFGFLLPDHPVLHKTGSNLDGIYIAGGCTGPLDASSAVTQALAASGDIQSKLVPGKKIELEPLTSVIEENLCAGCKMCISVCPYQAISFDPAKKISHVNEAICRGCGTCAATCPGKAIHAKHFTNDQITAEIGGILHE